MCILEYWQYDESNMAYQDGMKTREETQLAAGIETDLSRIKQLSQQHEDENWEFRSWLKQYAPENIDAVVKTLSQRYFSLSIAQTLGQSIKAFEKQFMSEGKVNPPCPMLDGKLCSIYEDRPEVCRSYPHLEQPHFTSRLMSVIDNVAICPIAFNAFEKLKTELGWSRDRHKRQR